MKRIAQYSQDEMKQISQERLKNVHETIDWSREWDTLMAWTGISYQKLLNSIKPFLATRVVPRFFSVLIHATVAGITQRLCVLVERTSTASHQADVQTPKKTETDKQTNGQLQKQPPFVCIIKKLYWL